MAPHKLQSLILTLFITATSVVGSDFESFKKHYTQDFINYQENINNQFATYKDAQKLALKEFKQELLQNWKIPELSTKHKWVEYSKDLQEKKSINYDNQTLKFEVHAKTKEEALQKMQNLFEETVHEDIATAVKNDHLEQKISTLLHKKVHKIPSKEKLITAQLTPKEQQKLKKRIVAKNIKHYSYKKDDFIYSIKLKLPNSVMAKNALRFHPMILKEAKKEALDPSLVYAIMHSESAFNPLARSYVPAFGLMQIVPKTAGIDSYRYLYGQKKMLSSEYLYVPQNNIKIGAAYLHLLYYNYLKSIKDPQSKIYCTIAAYNTGAGNVARAFTNNTNIHNASKIINRLSADEVYAHLIANLPYSETKHYLKIVNKRKKMYDSMLHKAQ